MSVASGRSEKGTPPRVGVCSKPLPRRTNGVYGVRMGRAWNEPTGSQVHGPVHGPVRGRATLNQIIMLYKQLDITSVIDSSGSLYLVPKIERLSSNRGLFWTGFKSTSVQCRLGVTCFSLCHAAIDNVLSTYLVHCCHRKQ